MNRFLDYLTNSPAAVLLLGSAVVAVVLFAVPSLHPAAWLIGLVLSVIILLAVGLAFREYARDQHRIDRLNEELALERGTFDGVPFSAADDPEVPADTRRAERLLAMFPTDDGLVQHLRITATFGGFDASAADEIRAFLDEFARTSFDDPAAHFAFMDFYRTADRFHNWLTHETSTVEGSDAASEITPGDQRTGGWHEYNDARRRGERLADDFVNRRADFWRIALENGIVA